MRTKFVLFGSFWRDFSGMQIRQQIGRNIVCGNSAVTYAKERALGNMEKRSRVCINAALLRRRVRRKRRGRPERVRPQLAGNMAKPEHTPRMLTWRISLVLVRAARNNSDNTACCHVDRHTKYPRRHSAHPACASSLYATRHGAPGERTKRPHLAATLVPNILYPCQA